MVIKKYTWFFFLLLLLNAGCKSVQHISKTDVSYQVMKADSSIVPDEKVVAMIAPYKVQLDTVMNEVLGTLRYDLTKQKPESNMGNWVADVLLESTQKAGYKADFSIINYGGLRLPSITAGPLTRGKLFELSPFDNMIMVVDVPGVVLDTIMRQIAASGGWPVSKGVKMVISNKMMSSCLIAGQPIDSSRIYKVATLDYVANGGDDMKQFIPLTRVQTGKILRDLLIDYVKKAKADGKDVAGFMEGRIIIH
jgi:2',3'-cyclic-nucleotide 2'-phosphodiesterase (5'-nucleotidase family)